MPRKYQKLFTLSNEHTKGVSSVAFSPHGSFIATADLDGKVCWWRMEDGELLYVWVGESAILSLAWVPEEEDSLLCGSKDGNLTTLRVTKDALYATGLWAHKYPLECITIDGQRVATGAHKEIKIWDWDTNHRFFALAETLPEPPKSSHNKDKKVIVTSLHWTTQESRLLMATYMHHGAQFFDASTGEMVRTFPITGMIASASLSPNGANLAVSNVSRGFDVYKIQSAEPIASFDNDDNPRTSSDEPACPVPVKFIHGGHAIVGGSMNGKVGLWDLGHGKMHTLPLNKPCKVLALDAYVVIKEDIHSSRFWIATGITTEGMSSCVIWEAGELVPTNAQTFSEAHSHLGVSYDGEVDRGPQRGGGISFVAKVVWSCVAILAIAYAVNRWGGMIGA